MKGNNGFTKKIKTRQITFIYRVLLIIIYLFPLMAACAAAKRAIGTRKGEQLT